MTQNQLAYANMQEQQRANLARETENRRSNLAHESQQHRNLEQSKSQFDQMKHFDQALKVAQTAERGTKAAHNIAATAKDLRKSVSILGGL